MTPTHAEAMAAAKRVKEAYEMRQLGELGDVVTMHTYQLSAELRRVPEHERVEAALRICRHIVANTRESLS